ncbi:MAG: aconitase family protein [Flavonifractor plautii]
MGIIQTARASGMQAFPLPYVLTNCHNSLCAVGGTINEDDHVFGLSAAKKYGGEFVPAHQSVIHSYMRERYAAPGRMILGSDSHTRYGAYGTMAIGEGGPELARQLLSKTYNIPYPKVIAIYLTGTPIPGVGPQDVALELIRSTFKDGVVKNAVMEFFGPGVANLSMDYRSGIDVMTTETTCLSSIWPADHTLKAHLAVLGRGEAFKPQAPADGAYYDGLIEVELDKIRPMIALPFHPSNAYTIQEFQENLDELLHQVDEDTVRQLKLKNRPASLREKIVDGKFRVDQGVIAGCSGGTYQNIVRAAQILDGRAIGSGEFWLSVYPTSQPVNLELTRRGYIASLMAAGASIRSCFCGPCFGAGDVPANGLSPSVTPPVTSPTGREQALRRAGVLRGPHGRPEHRRHRPQRRRAHRGRRAARTPADPAESPSPTTTPPTRPGSTSAWGGPTPARSWCSAPISPTGRSRWPCRRTCCSRCARPSMTPSPPPTSSFPPAKPPPTAPTPSSSPSSPSAARIPSTCPGPGGAGGGTAPPHQSW